MWLSFGRNLKVGLLASVLLLSVCLYSFSDEPPLTREEIETWTEETKIEAILILDNYLTESASSIVQQEIALRQREKSLTEREIDLNEREAILTLLEKESETWQKKNNEMFWKGFLTGQTKGSFEMLMTSIAIYNRE